MSLRIGLPSILSTVICGVAAWLWWQEQSVPTRPAALFSPQVAQIAQDDEEPLQEVQFPYFEPQNLLEVAQRPLFSPSRSPLQYVAPAPEYVAPEEPEIYVEEIFVEPTPEPPAPPPPIMLSMSGYMSGAQGASALIRNDDQKTEEWFFIGGDIAGWEIVSITSQSVTVSRDGSIFVVNLYE